MFRGLTILGTSGRLGRKPCCPPNAAVGRRQELQPQSARSRHLSSYQTLERMSAFE